MSCDAALCYSGGGSGIGRAICQVLAREGARVVVTDLNHIAAEKTMKDLEAIGNSNLVKIKRKLIN